MGNSQIKAGRNRIAWLEGQLSSTEAALASTKGELSSTKASLRASNQKVEELTKHNLDREIVINKLFEVGELHKQVSSTNVEALICKFNLDALRKEGKELKEQLSTQRKFEEDVEIKLHKVLEIEKQVLCVHEQVLSTKASLEASKKEEDMLNLQLLSLEEFQKDVEMKLEMVMKLEKQILDTKIEALSTKSNFEDSKMKEILLKEQLKSCEEFHQDMEMKFQNVMDLEKQLVFIRTEGLFVKASLEASRKQEEGLKNQLSELQIYQQDMELKLRKVVELENEICSYEAQTLSAMASLEATNNEVEELKEKLASLEKVQQAIVELKFKLL